MCWNKIKGFINIQIYFLIFFVYYCKVVIIQPMEFGYVLVLYQKVIVKELYNVRCMYIVYI